MDLLSRLSNECLNFRQQPKAIRSHLTCEIFGQALLHVLYANELASLAIYDQQTD